MRYFFFGLCLLLNVGLAQAQDSTAIRRDTTIAPAKPTTEADDLLAGLAGDSTEAQPLLPHKMIFTQRAFWGPKGLLRVMLVSHQIGGFVTLAGFVAQGFLGAKLYKAQGQEYVDTKRWHERSATFINVAYATTLALSLTTPPPVIGAKRGFTSIKLHKYLAVVHLVGMIATNVLAQKIQTNYELKPYHRAAAYTTFGAYAVSVAALTF
jgi:hypothetical protein